MKKNKILFLIILVFSLSGCWNYNELDELALVTGISIDKGNEGFTVNYMISNASKSDAKSSGNETGTVIYEGSGSTLSKAVENINQKLPKVPYLSHLEVVVISEEVAKDDILDTMDFLLRNPECRKEIYVLISNKVDAKDVLSILTPLESFPSENIKSNITSSPTSPTTTTTIKYSEFLKMLIEEGIDPSLGVVELEGNVNKGQSQESNDKSRQDAIIKLTTTAIFRNNKLIKFTDENESVAINILNNRLDNMYLETEYNGDSVVTYITSIKVKKKVQIENNIPKLAIEVSGDGSLLEVNSKIDLQEPKTINSLKSEAEEKLNSILYTVINIMKEEKTDVLGIGNYIYKYKNNYWKSIKNGWDDEILPNLDVKIKSNINLSSKGSLEQSIKEDLK